MEEVPSVPHDSRMGTQGPGSALDQRDPDPCSGQGKEEEDDEGTLASPMRWWQP